MQAPSFFLLLDLLSAQMERVRPETYIGEGDHFVFVTLKPLRFEKIQTVVRSRESPANSWMSSGRTRRLGTSRSDSGQGEDRHGFRRS